MISTISLICRTGENLFPMNLSSWNILIHKKKQNFPDFSSIYHDFHDFSDFDLFLKIIPHDNYWCIRYLPFIPITTRRRRKTVYFRQLWKMWMSKTPFCLYNPLSSSMFAQREITEQWKNVRGFYIKRYDARWGERACLLILVSERGVFELKGKSMEMRGIEHKVFCGSNYKKEKYM